VSATLLTVPGLSRPQGRESTCHSSVIPLGDMITRHRAPTVECPRAGSTTPGAFETAPTRGLCPRAPEEDMRTNLRSEHSGYYSSPWYPRSTLVEVERGAREK